MTAPSFLYEKLYREYRPVVYSYISARVPSREAAEDLCQDVFVKLLKALDTYDPKKSSLPTFLYRIAHNAVIDYYRTNRVHAELTERDAALPSSEDVVMDRARLKELAAALRLLPQEQRDVLILRFYRGWTLVRIAQEMGVPYHTAVNRQKSGLERLRKILSDNTAK